MLCVIHENTLGFDKPLKAPFVMYINMFIKKTIFQLNSALYVLTCFTGCFFHLLFFLHFTHGTVDYIFGVIIHFLFQQSSH